MKKQVVRVLKYVLFSSVLGCSSLCADDEEEMQEQVQVSAPSGGAHFVSTYDRVKGKEITPNAGPIVSAGLDISVQADYILWHASEGGLAYVASGVPNLLLAIATEDNLTQGIKRTPHFKLRSGFKVGLGLDFSYDGWDTGLLYTWLHSTASSSFLPPATGVNKTLWGGNFSVLSANQSDNELFFDVGTQSGNSKWKLRFNAVDWELGRNYFISPKLNLRPHFGLKGSWQTQKYNILYNQTGVSVNISVAGAPAASLTTAAEAYTIEHKQHYWGLGPRTGVDASWLFTENFCLFGDWAVAALWGQFKDTRLDRSTVTNANTGATLLTDYAALNTRSRIHELNTVLELAIGLRYDWWFSDDDYRVRMAAAWENQVWFNQNHFENYTADGINGDLSLQGFTLNLRFDF